MACSDRKAGQTVSLSFSGILTKGEAMQRSTLRQDSVWDGPLRISLYMFTFLLPFEGIVGRVSLGFLGGVKILGLLIAACLVLRVLGDPRRLGVLVKNLSSPISLSALLFTIWCLTSTFWAPNPTWALVRVSTYVGLFVVMQAIGLLKREHIKRMWELLLVGAALSVLLGFILPAPNELLAASGRFTSGGEDPNDYANLLVVTVGVTFFGILTFKTEVKGRLRRFVLVSSVLIVMVAILLSLSRTALVNLFLALIASPLLLFRRTAKLAIKVAALVGLGMVCIVILSHDFTERMVDRYSTLQWLQQEWTWAGRIDIWRAAVIVFTERPLTGVGAGNFAFVSPYYSYYAALIAATREGGGGGVAHNMFLSVMSETGMIGLILFGALLVSAYASARRLIRYSENLSYGLLIGLLAYTIAGLTLTWEYVKIPYLLYGSLLALRTRDSRHA